MGGGIGFQRQESPVRSGREPAGADAMPYSPAFIRASAQLLPPPENMA